jgi:two-component system chemotaxis response regulator CheY
LIVEDAESVGSMIGNMLELNGHEIAGLASNGQEAVEKYKALRPDVVLMDIVMPVMDGLSAIKKIKEEDQKARIIVVTAMVRESVKNESMEYGALDVIFKPFEVKRLLDAVKSATTVE